MSESSLIQLRSDIELQESLLKDSNVQMAIAKIRDGTNGFGFVARRRLLSHSLRVTAGMAPELMKTLEECRKVLQCKREIELFVRNDPQYNACAIENPQGTGIIVLSSHLVETLTIPELTFVLGHEVGHLAFNHLAVPMPYTAMVEDYGGVIVSRPTALRLFFWCRAAEMSADRAGLACSKDLNAAGSAFFKISSGVSSSDKITPDLKEFERQIDLLTWAPGAERSECDSSGYSIDSFETHPFSPSRVRALLAFNRSDTYRSMTGIQDDQETISANALEELVNEELSLMEPDYLQESTPYSKCLRRVLFVGGLSVLSTKNQIKPGEFAALQALLGPDANPREDLKDIQSELDTCIMEISGEIPMRDRARLIQHLTVIAGGDGEVADLERAQLYRIAEKLLVDPLIVDSTLDAMASPMD